MSLRLLKELYKLNELNELYELNELKELYELNMVDCREAMRVVCWTHFAYHRRRRQAR